MLFDSLYFCSVSTLWLNYFFITSPLDILRVWFKYRLWNIIINKRDLLLCLTVDYVWGTICFLCVLCSSSTMCRGLRSASAWENKLTASAPASSGESESRGKVGHLCSVCGRKWILFSATCFPVLKWFASSLQRSHLPLPAKTVRQKELNTLFEEKGALCDLCITIWTNLEVFCGSDITHTIVSSPRAIKWTWQVSCPRSGEVECAGDVFQTSERWSAFDRKQLKEPW